MVTMKAAEFKPLVFRKGTEHFYSPPFDTVGKTEEKVLKSFPYNITHITLPESDGNARGLLNAWKRDGVLQRLSDGVIFIIDQEFTHRGRKLKRNGIICIVKVYPVAEDIKPHELTFPGPRRGRYSLMTALGCQPEPIFLITPAKGLNALLDDALINSDPELVFEEPKGVMNRVHIISDKATLRRITDAVSHDAAIVADGHHRLAAVREIAEEWSKKGESAWNWAMAYVSPTEGEGLLIGGIHRVVRAVPGRKTDLSQVGEFFDLRDASEDHRGQGIIIYDGKMRYAEPNERSRALVGEIDFDIAPDVVNKLLFKKCLAMTDSEIESNVAYTHDAEYATEAVDSGHAALSVFMPDWNASQFAEKVSGGRLLPQKSTFFFPKVPSGISLYEPD